MIYQYQCEKCGHFFCENFSMNGNEKNKPLQEPCPSCNEIGSVGRDFGSVSLTYDTMDVTTRAKKVAGEGFGEVMKRIHKGMRHHSKMNV